MRPSVFVRTAYGAEVTVSPEQGGNVWFHERATGGDTRKWVLRPEYDGAVAEVVLSHADLVALSAQLAALVERER